MSKKHVYRVGDPIIIMQPKWVKRVGYPIVWTDLIEEVRSDKRTMAAWNALGFASIHPDDFPLDFIRGIAMHKVKLQRFGGNARSIHYRPLSANLSDDAWALVDDDTVPHHGYVGRRMDVLRKRVVQTGTRVPPRGYDEDWEPGYLDDSKTHVLLTTWAGEIEAVNVRPAQKGNLP